MNTDESLFDFSEFEDAWTNAEVSEEEVSTDEPPYGEYYVNVEKVHLDKTKPSEKYPQGNKRFNMQLKIIGSKKNGDKYNGRVLFKNAVIATNESIKYLKQDLVRCGLKLKSMTELPMSLNKLLDVKLRVSKVKRKDAADDLSKYNLYILGLYDEHAGNNGSNGGSEAGGQTDDSWT